MFDFGSTTGSTNFLIVKTNATVTFGSLVDLNDFDTKDGCSFLVSAGGNVWSMYCYEANANLYLYSCSLSVPYGKTNVFAITGAGATNNGVIRVVNCILAHNTQLLTFNSGSLVFNVNVQSSVNSALQGARGASVSRLYAFSTAYYVQLSGTTVNTISNLYGRNAATAAVRMEGTTDVNLVDADLDSWTFIFTNTGEVYRKYTYDLTVLNGEITDFVEDANVTLSKGGVQIGTWLTNSSGQIETQTLTYGYYNSTGGDTIYDGSNPFVLTVTHEDWADYTSRFYVTEKTKMTISMQDTTTANNAALIWSMLFGTLAFAVFFVWWVRR